MTGRHGNQKFTPRFIRPVLACTMIIALGFVDNPSWSQADGPVSVDLSVLNDGGVRSSSSLPAYASGGDNLLVPPAKVPVSKLHIAPSSAPKLVRPATTPMPKTVVKAPAPKKIAKAKPKKMMPPASKPQPAPAPAPAAKVEVSTPAPPAPPVPAETKTAKAAGPAPAAAPAPPAPPAPEPVKSKAPPPPPKVAEAPKPAEAAKTMASANAGIDIKPGQAVRIEFGETATKIPGAIKGQLRAVAEGVRDKADLRLQLMAFAGAEGLSASKARRMSLSRALSVRSFLIENGVRSTRIDVRALGNKTSEKPANRVDVNIAKR